MLNIIYFITLFYWNQQNIITDFGGKFNIIEKAFECLKKFGIENSYYIVFWTLVIRIIDYIILSIVLPIIVHNETNYEVVFKIIHMLSLITIPIWFLFLLEFPLGWLSEYMHNYIPWAILYILVSIFIVVVTVISDIIGIKLSTKRSQNTNTW